MDIKRQGASFYRKYDDGENYYLKNDHGNILEVTKVILMERFGFIFTTAKDTSTEDRVGVWRKKLPAEEGFEMATKEEWQEMENERLKIIPAPVEKPKEEIKMGPDETQFNQPPVDPEAEAKARAEDEAAKAAEAEVQANAEAGEGEQI